MIEETITPDSKAQTVAPEHAKALLERLIQAYPAAFFPFSERQVKPLKIGIYKDLMPVIKEWGYQVTVLKYVLRNYTRPLRYQLALLQAPHRIDLQGEPAGEVSPDHRQIAQEKANLIKEKRKQHQPDSKAGFGRSRRPRELNAARRVNDTERHVNDTERHVNDTERHVNDTERRVNDAKLAALQQKLSTKALP